MKYTTKKYNPVTNDMAIIAIQYLKQGVRINDMSECFGVRTVHLSSAIKEHAKIKNICCLRPTYNKSKSNDSVDRGWVNITPKMIKDTVDHIRNGGFLYEKAKEYKVASITLSRKIRLSNNVNVICDLREGNKRHYRKDAKYRRKTDLFTVSLDTITEYAKQQFTLEKIGEMHGGISRERARQIFGEYFNNLNYSDLRRSLKPIEPPKYPKRITGIVDKFNDMGFDVEKTDIVMPHTPKTFIKVNGHVCVLNGFKHISRAFGSQYKSRYYQLRLRYLKEMELAEFFVLQDLKDDTFYIIPMQDMLRLIRREEDGKMYTLYVKDCRYGYHHYDRIKLCGCKYINRFDLLDKQ